MKNKAPRNKTIILNDTEKATYALRLITLNKKASLKQILNKTIHQDIFSVLPYLPRNSVDLLFLDPPYNITKVFNKELFKGRSLLQYMMWFESWFGALLHVLKPTASVYICGDWRSSTVVHMVAEKYLKIQNRIVWARDKGRGAKNNWKNNSEDIWFCTASNDYYFNVDAVKLKKKVIAPYRNQKGQPKGWEESEEGRFRLTYPSNIWNDLTVPFWSMPENTEHPTQKPEKLLARIILASSKEGDVILDPFLGSGTTSVVAKKLNRNFIGIEKDLNYCCLAEKRLEMANDDTSIQGYYDGYFWERNTKIVKKKVTKHALNQKRINEFRK